MVKHFLVLAYKTGFEPIEQNSKKPFISSIINNGEIINIYELILSNENFTSCNSLAVFNHLANELVLKMS